MDREMEKKNKRQKRPSKKEEPIKRKEKSSCGSFSLTRVIDIDRQGIEKMAIKDRNRWFLFNFKIIKPSISIQWNLVTVKKK